MRSRITCLAAAILCVSALEVHAQTLSIGDDAPAIEVSKWVKGEKVERLEKDRTYVVEFWATWCGPCRVSIPHITQLQQSHKDIRFMGVAVWEQDQKKVAPFVETMGDKMNYSVALDNVPDGQDGNNGKMAKNWMTASASQGIPTAFIVKNGKIAWIGHPMMMDQPLEKVISPTFDLAKAASEAREARVREVMLNSFMQKFMARDKGASALGTELVEGALKDDSESLNQIAWLNLDPDSNIPEANRDIKLVLKAAKRADELTKGESGTILDTLALAYFKTGEPAKALQAQEKAIKLMGDGDPGMKDRLNQYRKAVAEKKP